MTVLHGFKSLLKKRNLPEYQAGLGKSDRLFGPSAYIVKPIISE